MTGEIKTTSAADIDSLNTAYLESLTEGTNILPSSDDIVKNKENARLITVLPEITPIANIFAFADNSNTNFTKATFYDTKPYITNEYPMSDIEDEMYQTKNVDSSTFEINKDTIPISITTQNFYDSTTDEINHSGFSDNNAVNKTYPHSQGESLTKDTSILIPGDKIVKGTENQSQPSILLESQPGTALNDKLNIDFSTEFFYITKSTTNQYATTEIRDELTQSKDFDTSTSEINKNTIPIIIVNHTINNYPTEVIKHTGALDTDAADIDIDLNKDIYYHPKPTTNLYPMTEIEDKIIQPKEEIGFSTFKVNKDTVPISSGSQTINGSVTDAIQYSGAFDIKFLDTTHPRIDFETLTEESNVLVTGDQIDTYNGNEGQIISSPVPVPVTSALADNFDAELYTTNQYPISKIGYEIIKSKDVYSSTNKIDRTPIYKGNQKIDDSITETITTPLYTYTPGIKSFSTTHIKLVNITENTNIPLPGGKIAQSSENGSQISISPKTESILTSAFHDNLETDLDKYIFYNTKPTDQYPKSKITDNIIQSKVADSIKKIDSSITAGIKQTGSSDINTFNTTHSLSQQESITENTNILLPDDKVVQKPRIESQITTSPETKPEITFAFNDNLDIGLSVLYTTYPQSERESITEDTNILLSDDQNVKSVNESLLSIPSKIAPITIIPAFADKLDTDFSNYLLYNTKPYLADKKTQPIKTISQNSYDSKIDDYTFAGALDVNPQLNEVFNEVSAITVSSIKNNSFFTQPDIATKIDTGTVVPFKSNSYTILHTDNESHLANFPKENNELLTQIFTDKPTFSPAVYSDKKINLNNITESPLYTTQENPYKDHTDSIKTTTLVNNMNTQEFISKIDIVSSNLDDTTSTNIELNIGKENVKSSSPEYSVSNMINKIKKILKKDRTFSFSSGFDITFPKPDLKQHNQNTTDLNISKVNKGMTSKKAAVQTTNDFKFETSYPSKLIIHTLPKNKTDNMNNIISVDKINNYSSSLLPNMDSKIFYILKNSGNTITNTTKPSFINTLGNKAHVSTRNETYSSNPDLDQTTIIGLMDDKYNAPNNDTTFSRELFQVIQTEAIDKTSTTKTFSTKPHIATQSKPRHQTNTLFTRVTDGNPIIIHDLSSNKIRSTSDLNTEPLKLPNSYIYDIKRSQTDNLHQNISNLPKHLLDKIKTPVRTHNHHISGMNTKTSVTSVPLLNTSLDQIIPKGLVMYNVSYNLMKPTKYVIVKNSTDHAKVQVTSRPHDVLVIPNMLNKTVESIEHNTKANNVSTVSSDMIKSLTAQDSQPYLNQKTNSYAFIKKLNNSPMMTMFTELPTDTIAFDSLKDYSKYVKKDNRSFSLSTVDARKSFPKESLNTTFQGTLPYSLKPREYYTDGLQVPFKINDNRSTINVNQNVGDTITKISINLRQPVLTDNFSDTRGSLDTKLYTFGYKLNSTDNNDTYVTNNQLMISSHIKVNELPTINRQLSQNTTPYSASLNEEKADYLKIKNKTQNKIITVGEFNASQTKFANEFFTKNKNISPNIHTNIYNELLNNEFSLFNNSFRLSNLSHQNEREFIDKFTIISTSTESSFQSALNTNVPLQKAVSYMPLKIVEEDKKIHNTTQITVPYVHVFLASDRSAVTISTSRSKSQSLTNNNVTSQDKEFTTTSKTSFEDLLKLNNHSNNFRSTNDTSAEQIYTKSYVLHAVKPNIDPMIAEKDENTTGYHKNTNSTDTPLNIYDKSTNIPYDTSNNLESTRLTMSPENSDLKYKTLNNARVSQNQIITTFVVPNTTKKNESVQHVSNKEIAKSKDDLKNLDYDNLFTKTIFITSRIVNNSRKVLKNIVKSKFIFHTNLSKHINLVKSPTSYINNARFSQDNGTEKSFVRFSKYYNQKHPINDTYVYKQNNYHRTIQPTYFELLARSGKENNNHLVEKNKPKHETTKSIVYNTYKALTEEELTLPPDVRKIKTTYSTIYTKQINSIKSLLNVKASKPRSKQTKFNLKSEVPSRLLTDKYNTTKTYNDFEDTLINDTLYNFNNNITYLHPIEKLSKQTQWRSLNRIHIKNRKRPIIMMNTDDFLYFRKPVTTKGNFFEMVKSDSLPVPRHQINVPSVRTTVPKRVILRPKFNSFEDFKMNPLRRVMPKEVIMPDDRDFYRSNFQFHHKPGQSWREKIGEVRTKLKPRRRSGVETARKIKFEPVIDVPYYMPTLMKPNFLRDKVESVRTYIYNEEKNQVNGRRHFKSPPRVDKSGVIVDASDTQEHMYYSAERSPEQTQSPSPQVTRPKKTIFFLSPTVPYNRYF
ncbi:uncharacterized protein LOC134806154 [Cydia splendana]|uniref:uncharacterized protein LOC134806154 n=1 Tax=Cydia splendana TaxID=1100963 RepID=UPI00300D44EC